ncbi:MAG: hypothetical protein Q4G48_03485, partial [Bacteroidia bacterium]|nr:hypothetical protein [Bacteroidia bacterium]
DTYGFVKKREHNLRFLDSTIHLLIICLNSDGFIETSSYGRRDEPVQKESGGKAAFFSMNRHFDRREKSIEIYTVQQLV